MSCVKVDSSSLSQSEEIVVDGQESSTFTLANYVDEVMCDVVLVEATLIFLVIHDGVINKFSFEHMRHKVVLKPLSQGKICEDKIKMRIKKEERKEKEKIEKARERKREKKSKSDIEKIYPYVHT
ncbi:hypothetical protein CR513_21764, partial [Mucuna pruriens]